MRVRLTSAEGVLVEAKAETIVSETVIGRDPECKWLVPKQFQRVGRQHAKLVREGRRLFIEDPGSLNGTFLGNRRITREEVVPGRSFMLGQTLTLEAHDDASEAVDTTVVETNSVKTAARLVGWSGAARGKHLDLVSVPFLIGSETPSPLPASSDWISKKHAEIVRGEDGGYAIRDLGSTNGTSVNGRKLSPETLQALRHGDRVFFADQGFFFDDGRGIHPERQAWLVGVSVAASLVLLAVGYRVSMRPTLERNVARADRLAAVERFDEAVRVLAKVKETDLETSQAARLSEARTRLRVWESTFKAWAALTNALASGNWRTASDTLGALSTGRPEAWGWREGGDRRSQEAGRIVAVFTNWVVASDALSEGGVATPAILSALDTALTSMVGEPRRPYADTLLRQAEDCRTRMKERLSIGEHLGCLNRLQTWPPPVDAVVADLDRICREEQGSWVQYAEKSRDALKPLSDALSANGSALRSLIDMAPDEARRAMERAGLPAAAAVDPRIAQLAKELTARRDQISSLAQLIGELAGDGQEGEAVNRVKVWENKDAIKKVLACDTASMGPRDPDRSTPVGEYDRYVGTEAFYGFCLWLKGESSFRPLVTPFKTELKRLQDFYRQVGELIELVKRIEQSGDKIQMGALGGFIKRCRAQADGRDALVGDFAQAASAGDNRQALIAAGIALQLAARPELLTTEIAGKSLRVRDLALSRFESCRQELPSR